MNKLLPLFAAAAWLLVPASNAKAELVTYEFTATVTSGDYAGETINGTIVIEDDTPDSRRSRRVGKYAGAVDSYTMEMESGDVIEGSSGDVTVVDTFFYDSTTVSDHGGETTINGSDPAPGNFVLKAIDVGWNPDLNDSDDLTELGAMDLEDADYDKLRFTRDGATFTADITSFGPAGSVAASVPELSAGEAPAAFAIVLGAAAIVHGRRRVA